MALAGTDRGSGTHGSSGLTFTLSPASNFTAGALAVLSLAADNSAFGGSTNNIVGVTDSLGNTWTKRQSPLYDPGAASAGVQGAIFTSPQNGGTLQTSTVITVEFADNTTAKAWTLMEVTGNNPSYVTGGVGTGSATASPTVTTGSITNGRMVIAALCNEYGTEQTVTEDSDTTNGSWSTQQTAEVGSEAFGITVASQRKVVSATATQTYNPTLGVSSDCICAWIEIQESVAYTLTAATGAFTLTGVAANFKRGFRLTCSAASFSLTGISATFKRAKRLVCSVGAFVLTGVDAGLTWASSGRFSTMVVSSRSQRISASSRSQEADISSKAQRVSIGSRNGSE